MNARRFCGSILVLCSLVAVGCDHTGKPAEGAEPMRPDKVTNFDQLYSQNCSGCHGADGTHGAAMPLGNPEALPRGERRSRRLPGLLRMRRWQMQERATMTQNHITSRN